MKQRIEALTHAIDILDRQNHDPRDLTELRAMLAELRAYEESPERVHIIVNGQALTLPQIIAVRVALVCGERDADMDDGIRARCVAVRNIMQGPVTELAK